MSTLEFRFVPITSGMKSGSAHDWLKRQDAFTSTRTRLWSPWRERSEIHLVNFNSRGNWHRYNRGNDSIFEVTDKSDLIDKLLTLFEKFLPIEILRHSQLVGNMIQSCPLQLAKDGKKTVKWTLRGGLAERFKELSKKLEKTLKYLKEFSLLFVFQVQLLQERMHFWCR